MKTKIFQNYLQRPTALLLVIAVLIVGIGPGIFLKPQKAEAFGLGSVGNFILQAGKFIWEIIKDVAKEAILAAKEIVKQKLLNKEWWIKKLEDAAIGAAHTFATQYLDKTVDDLTGWIEGEKGKPRYIKNIGDYTGEAADAAGASFLNTLTETNLCKSLKSKVITQFSAKKEGKPFSVEKFQGEAGCTLGEIEDNLEGFYDNFTGGWDAWLKISEPQNNIYGITLMASNQQTAMAEEARKEAEQKYASGQGWADTEMCTEWTDPITGQRFKKEIPIGGVLLGVEGKIVDAKNGKTHPLPIVVQHPNIKLSRSTDSPETVEIKKQTFGTVVTSCATDPPVENYELDALYIKLLFGTKVNIGAELLGTISNRLLGAGKSIDWENPSLGEERDRCLIETLGYTCTKTEVLTPGSAVGKTITSALQKRADQNFEGLEHRIVTEIVTPEQVGDYAKAISDASMNRILQEGIGAAKWGADKLGLGPDDEGDEWLGDPCEYPGFTEKMKRSCRNLQKIKLNRSTGINDLISGAEDSAKYQTILMIEDSIDKKKQIQNELKTMASASAAKNTQEIVSRLEKLATCRWQKCVKEEISLQLPYDEETKDQCVKNYCGNDSDCDDKEDKICNDICINKFPLNPNTCKDGCKKGYCWWKQEVAKEASKNINEALVREVGGDCAMYSVTDKSIKGNWWKAVLGTAGLVWATLTKTYPDKATCAYKSHPKDFPRQGLSTFLAKNEDGTNSPSNPDALCFYDGEWQDAILQLQDAKHDRTIVVQDSSGNKEKIIPSWIEERKKELEKETGSKTEYIQISGTRKPYASVNLKDLQDLSKDGKNDWMGWSFNPEIWNNIGELRKMQWYILYVSQSLDIQQKIIEWLEWWENPEENALQKPMLSPEAEEHWKRTLVFYFSAFRAQWVLDYLTEKKDSLNSSWKKAWLRAIYREFQNIERRNDIETWNDEKIDKAIKELWLIYNKDGEMEAWLKTLASMREKTLEPRHKWSINEFPISQEQKEKLKNGTWSWLIDGAYIGVSESGDPIVQFPDVTKSGEDQRYFSRGNAKIIRFNALERYKINTQRDLEYKKKYDEEAERLVDLEGDQLELEKYKTINSPQTLRKEVDKIENAFAYCKCLRDDKDLLDPKCAVKY